MLEMAQDPAMMLKGGFEPAKSTTPDIEIDEDSEMAPWFASGWLPSGIESALSELKNNGVPGNFLIHDMEEGSPKAATFTLSYVGANGEVEKCFILHSRDGFQLAPNTARRQSEMNKSKSKDSHKTLTTLVEAYSTTVSPLIGTLLRGDAPYQSSFSESLGRRTTSRRVKQREQDVNLSHLGKINTNFKANSLEVDDEAKAAHWFLSGKPREAVKAMVFALMQEGKPGEFIVRDKQNVEGLSGAALNLVFALNVKVDNKTLMCYLIESSKRKFFVRGTENERFNTLTELVKFYTEEPRDSMSLKLEFPQEEYLDAAYREAQQELSNPGSTARRFSSTGLPGWLRVDADIKANVRASVRKRAESKRDVAYDMAKSTEDPMYSMASDDKNPQYDTARRDDAPEYATARRDDPAYNLASKNDAPTYAMASETDTPQYDTARPRTGIYADLDVEASGDPYKMANGNETDHTFTATRSYKGNVYSVSLGENSDAGATYDNVAGDGGLYATAKPIKEED
eukprot:m.32944 g.32944  ORF g.32944 m.32944 type:complete len:513 (+) comp8470_c1_seq1:245-1783(+)